jgi:hypothetical protein
MNLLNSYSDVITNEPFDEWTKKWDRIEINKKLDHTQKFFRMLLSDDTDMYYYYSFCRDDIFDYNCYWHCIKCKKCLGWKEWHCGECDKCMYSNIIWN